MCACVPNEYYLCVVGDGQHRLMAKYSCKLGAHFLIPGCHLTFAILVPPVRCCKPDRVVFSLNPHTEQEQLECALHGGYKGPIASHGQRGEYWKIDLELMRFDVSVGALQEMKWFGDNVYEVIGSVVLTAAAGQPMPAEGVTVQRGEGVALVLMGLALASWIHGESNGGHGAPGMCQYLCSSVAVPDGCM